MLTTIENLRLKVGLDAFDTSQDAILNGFARMVQARFERDANRLFERLTGAQEEFDGNVVVLSLQRYPVETLTSFELKANETDGWEPVTGVEYLLLQGSIVRLAAALGTVDELMRVTYTGGYVLPGTTVETGQTALPSEIEDACLQQVSYMHQHRDKLGLVSQWDSGSMYRQWTKMDLLPEVDAIVQRYRRYTL